MLFYNGIDLGVLPFVRYTLENHNSFWTRKDLRRELTFYLSRIAVSVGNIPIMEKNKSYNPNHLDTQQRNSFENSSFTLITYLILKNEISLFDYMIQPPDVRNFSFGVGSKNGVGNTPFHTLGKYGSEAMIQRFLKEDDLVTLCLNVDNIQGEYGQGEENLNPVQLAQKFNRPQTVIDLLLSHPIVKERCLK